MENWLKLMIMILYPIHICKPGDGTHSKYWRRSSPCTRAWFCNVSSTILCRNRFFVVCLIIVSFIGGSGAVVFIIKIICSPNKMVPAFWVITNAYMRDTVGVGSYEFKLVSYEIKPIGCDGSVCSCSSMVIGSTRGGIAPCIRRKFIQAKVDMNEAWF